MLGHDTQETSIFLNLRLVPQAPLKTLMMVDVVDTSKNLESAIKI